MADQWFYSNDGRQHGPVSEAELRELAARGDLRPTDLVWTEGMSAWAPAGATRSLFPPRAAASNVPGAPDTPDVPVVQSPEKRVPAETAQAPRRRDWGEEDDGYYRRARRTAPQGMSTGVKVAIACSIVGVLALGGMIAVVIIGVAVGSAASLANNPPPPPPPAPARGGNNPQPMNANPPQPNSYQIKFQRVGEENVKVITLQKGQVVRITVTTTSWAGNDGFFQPDIDLFVDDMNGQLVVDEEGPVLDDGPEKDCDVVFRAPYTGQYRIRVRNLDAAWAQCTVRY